MAPGSLLTSSRHRWILPVCEHCKAPVQNLPIRGDGSRFEAPRVGSVLCLKCGCRCYFRDATWVRVAWSEETGEFVPMPGDDP